MKEQKAKEPIKQKLLLLMVIFGAALGVIFSLDTYSQHYIKKSDEAISNQMSHRRMGRVLIRELICIEAFISKSLASEDVRQVLYLKRDLSNSIKVLNSALETLQNGGVFTDRLPSNINDTDYFKEEYSYLKTDAGYAIEAIDLKPRIVDIKNLADEFFDDLIDHLEIGDGDLENHKRLLQYSKEMDTYLIRSREGASKIFLESNRLIEQLQEDRASLMTGIEYLRLSTFAFIVAFGSFFFFTIYRQVVVILNQNKFAENNLRLEKDKLQSLIDGLASFNIGISIIGVDEQIYFQNDVLDEVFGDSVVNGNCCHQRYMRKAEPCEPCPVKQAVEDYNVHQIETTNDAGKILEILAAPITNIDGSVDKAIEIVRDVTIARHDKALLQENEQRLMSILNSIHAGIVVISQATRQIIFANPAAAIMCQTTVEDMLGKVCHQFICPNQMGNCPIIDKGMTVDESEKKLLKIDGDLLDIRKTVIPIELNNEKCLLETFIDISAFKNAEKEMASFNEQLVQAKEEVENTNRELEIANEQAIELAHQAKSASKSKSEFLANMSHEIRTPMNSILGFSEMLMSSDLNEEQLDIVTTINRSGNALLTLINDILDFSKIEAGKMDMEIIDFDIKELIKDVCEIIKPKVKPGVKLLFTCAKGLPEWLKGDPGRLRQVLINLLGNAVKFTDSGEIRLQLKCLAQDENEVTIEFAIHDTGIGISDEKQKQIFEAFQQADGSITRRYGGTGLGLAISRRIIELMDSELKIESVENEGSRFFFTVTLPIGKEVVNEYRGMSDGLICEKPDCDVRVLVVDDDPINLKLTTKLLANSGYTFETALNGFEAIEKVKQGGYDIVLMDMQMPVMDGLESTIRIRELEIDIPVIALTANAFEADRQSCFESGMNDYLSKPLKRDLVLNCINKWVTACNCKSNK